MLINLLVKITYFLWSLLNSIFQVNLTLRFLIKATDKYDLANLCKFTSIFWVKKASFFQVNPTPNFFQCSCNNKSYWSHYISKLHI